MYIYIYICIYIYITNDKKESCHKNDTNESINHPTRLQHPFFPIHLSNPNLGIAVSAKCAPTSAHNTKLFFVKKIKNERQQKGKEGIKRQAKKISFLQ